MPSCRGSAGTPPQHFTPPLRDPGKDFYDDDGVCAAASGNGAPLSPIGATGKVRSWDPSPAPSCLRTSRSSLSSPSRLLCVRRSNRRRVRPTLNSWTTTTPSARYAIGAAISWRLLLDGETADPAPTRAVQHLPRHPSGLRSAAWTAPQRPADIERLTHRHACRKQSRCRKIALAANIGIAAGGVWLVLRLWLRPSAHFLVSRAPRRLQLRRGCRSSSTSAAARPKHRGGEP